MTATSLEEKIRQAGNPAQMLRHSSMGPYPFPYPSEHSNWRDEQEAWKKTAVLFDQSNHMTDVYFKGPDVKRLLSDTGVNNFTNFGRDKAKQYIAVNYDGYMIGDAVLFGLEEDEVSVVGLSVCGNWMQFHVEKGGYDVEVIRDEMSLLNRTGRRTYRYEIAGPNAMKIIEKAHGGPIEHIKFFNMGSFTIAGSTVRALNHTMADLPGAPMTGLELFGPAQHGKAVLDALLSAGEEFGLRRGGFLAYASTIAESGWLGQYVPAIYTGAKMKAYREWLPAESLEGIQSVGGSFVSKNIDDYYFTPWDLGYGNMPKYDHDFIGRSALEKMANQPHRRKVWLRWNDEDVARVIASSLFGGDRRAKYLAVPWGTYATMTYDKVLLKDRLVGVSAFTMYTANVRSFYSLAVVNEDVAEGTEVAIVWGEEDGGTPKPTVERHTQTEIRATVRLRSPVSR